MPVTGVYPDYEIDYAKALVSRGNLAGAVDASASSTGPNQLTLSWNDNSGIGNAQATDQALVVAYNASKKDVAFKNSDVRADATSVLSMPAGYSGDTVQVYLGFVSADGSRIANSVFLGSVVVQ
jgi:hypothetical protein